MKILKRLKNYWNQNRFLNKVFLLVGGTAAAQGLQLIFSPVLTRLYSPHDFGLLSIFISIVGISSKLVNLRYPLAIPLPKEDDKALNILALSLVLTVGLSLVITSVLWGIRDNLLSILNAVELKNYIWIIGISIFGIGMYQTLNQWAIRKQAYGMITVTKMNQSITQLILQLVFGFLHFGKVGLLLGDAFGRMGGSGLFLSFILKKNKRDFHKISLKKMWKFAKLYRRFPLYSSWSSLLNGLALHITPLILAMNYGTSVAGFWALSERVIGGPMGLLGMAVAQVFLGEGAKHARTEPKKFKRLFYRTAKTLFIVGSIPTLILLLTGPLVFGFIFGEEWQAAGYYVQILSVMFLAQLTMSPLSSTLDILQKQDWELVWDLARVILVVTGLLLASYFNLAPIYAVLIYSVIMLIAYISLFFLCTTAIKQFVNEKRKN